jgi:hypothetical protein
LNMDPFLKQDGDAEAQKRERDRPDPDRGEIRAVQVQRFGDCGPRDAPRRDGRRREQEQSEAEQRHEGE